MNTNINNINDNTNNIIELINLKKKYGKETILDIDYFAFKEGNVYLLIGGNGAGKSTLIKSILGFLHYFGEIKINTDSLAYLPERIQKCDFLSIEEYLNLVLDLNEKTIRSEILSQLLEKFNLDKNYKVTSLSKGMFQKMNIILTFILDRKLIFLDEPLNGLDKQTQEMFIDMIGEEKNKGKTFIISSHYPSIYKRVTDKVIKIENKRIVEKRIDEVIFI